MTADKPKGKVVRLEVEVPGTPEQVWEAIATGPGVTSWFVPAEVEPRVGGEMVTRHGEGEDMVGREKITAYDPPHRIRTEYDQGEEGGPPPLATEWLVEAKDGGTCIVRLVTGAADGGTDWDDDLESMERGWIGYMQLLRLYMTHFAGQRCSTVMVTTVVPGSKVEAWAEFRRALGVAEAGPGEPFEGAPGTPPLSGTVEATPDTWAILRLDRPSPGLALMATYSMGGPSVAMVHLYLYGDEGETSAPIATAAWREWIDARYAAVAG